MTRERLRVLVFNLAMDVDHPLLGFTSQWIEALAQRVEHIHVVTMLTGSLRMPDNVVVHSLGKERNFSKPKSGLELYRLVSSILLRERVDVCFSHMVLSFPILTAPLLRMRRIPLITWYAATEMSFQVKLAHALSRRIVTSLAPAYPYRHDEKLRVVGQGIDTRIFHPDPSIEKEDPPLILCVGRLSPIKDHQTLLEATSLLRGRGLAWRLRLVGDPAPSSEDHAYADALRRVVRETGLDDQVTFVPSVRLDEVPLWHRRASLHVNMTPTGSGDKTVLEAMCCGTPSIVANEGFRETLGPHWELFSFRHGRARELAERIAWWLAQPDSVRTKIGESLRKRVMARHDLDGLADRLIAQMKEVAMTGRSMARGDC